MALLRFTIFGATGFIGSRLSRHLEAMGAQVSCPPRGTELASVTGGTSLGHVVYAIGLTGDFRSRPFDTVEAHVSLLAGMLRQMEYESFLYLSTTRVYAGLQGPVDEETPVKLLPSRDRLYDLSKLTGEALVLAQDNPAARVARLSNVIGPGQSKATFIGSVVDDLQKCGKVTIGEAPESCKDYIDVADAVDLIARLAEHGSQRLYCLASGKQTTHGQIAGYLSGHGDVRFHETGAVRRFPQIRTDRIESEFGFIPKDTSESLSRLFGQDRN